jgi:hypothetical protein
MVEVRQLDPHDPMPDGGRRVIVMHRLDEDDPRHTHTEILLTGAPGRGESVRPMRPDGTPMPLDEAIEAAKRVADSEGLQDVYVVDRTAGPREKEVLAAGGDHSVNMDKLSDDDPEDGERGTDMRDAHRSRGQQV